MAGSRFAQSRSSLVLVEVHGEEHRDGNQNGQDGVEGIGDAEIVRNWLINELQNEQAASLHYDMVLCFVTFIISCFRLIISQQDVNRLCPENS